MGLFGAVTQISIEIRQSKTFQFVSGFHRWPFFPAMGQYANGAIFRMSGSGHMERARTNLAAGMGLRADVPLSLFVFQRIVWMSDRPPTPVLAPKIFRFSDVDEFRSSIRNLDVDFTPLARKISAEQIILNLAECDVNYTKSFPRITDGQLAPNCTAVGFSMDDGIPTRFNSAERDDAVICIGYGGATYSHVERTPRQFASIILTGEIVDRGWPRVGANFRMFETSVAAQHVLRELILQVTSGSPQRVNPVDLAGVLGCDHGVTAGAVDNAFANVVMDTSSASCANSNSQFKVFRDVQAVLSGDFTQPIYSSELARRIGVSVRTMHDAVKRYRGMSLHRYLRLRRLWLVRKRLMEGSQSVKACALAFGFWHLGDFSRSYRSQFGEAPSETLARSRERSR